MTKMTKEKMMNEQRRLGIDIGRVLISPGDPNAPQDTSFLHGKTSKALETPPMEDMFDVVPALVELFEGRVWLVSKAGPRIQQRTRKWLKHHDFYRRTGIREKNLRFCRERHQKAEHCSQLRITHFIDDRYDVLRHLRKIVPNLYIFGPQKRDIHAPWLQPTLHWQDVASLLLDETSA